MSSKKYTDKQKLAYYKKKAAAAAVQGQGRYRVPRMVKPLSGRGKYKGGDNARPISTGAGTLVGSAIGTAIGGPGAGTAIGGALGGLAGNALGNFFGWGEYTLRRNTLSSAISEGNSPARMHSSQSELHVTHREYITDIVSSSVANTFQLTSFPINPGLVQSFPWLAPIAQQFEEYEILGMIYEFKSLSADAIANTTNTALGYVIMSTDYNATNDSFVNKQEMENTEYTTSFKPSISGYHPIECDPRQNVLNRQFIRQGAPPANADLRLYDLGNFQIATSMPGTSVTLGELWCSYDIILRRPKNSFSIGRNVLSDHFQLGTVANATPLGTTSTVVDGSSLGGSIASSGLVYSFPPLFQTGTYMFMLSIDGSSTASITSPSYTYANCSLKSVWRANAGANTGTPNGVTSSRYNYIAYVQITAANATITLGTGGTLPSSATSGDLWVTQVDYDLLA